MFHTVKLLVARNFRYARIYLLMIEIHKKMNKSQKLRCGVVGFLWYWYESRMRLLNCNRGQAGHFGTEKLNRSTHCEAVFNPIAYRHKEI